MSLGRFVAPGFALLLLAGCGRAQGGGEVEFNLPSMLSEASGLAVAGPESVFTHEDEHAIVYEVRLDDGRIPRAFALGKPTIEGDFEGIAAAQGRVFLITSDGLIYSAPPGKNGQRVAYRVYDSGVGKHCEIEGLSNAPELGRLLILCKRLRDQDARQRLEIYEWRIGSERAEDAPWLSLPLDGLIAAHDFAEWVPSALEWDPGSGHLLIVSGHNQLLLILDRHGKLVARRRFDPARHPKVEGIAIMPDRRLVLADEGSRTRSGRLASYPMEEVPSPGSP
jgi:uncharacterized protein YjiK